jgi:hypothetical protein
VGASLGPPRLGEATGPTGQRETNGAGETIAHVLNDSRWRSGSPLGDPGGHPASRRADREDLKALPGTRSVYAERVAQGYFTDIRIDRDGIARHGLTIEGVTAVTR